MDLESQEEDCQGSGPASPFSSSLTEAEVYSRLEEFAHSCTRKNRTGSIERRNTLSRKPYAHVLMKPKLSVERHVEERCRRLFETYGDLSSACVGRPPLQGKAALDARPSLPCLSGGNICVDQEFTRLFRLFRQKLRTWV